MIGWKIGLVWRAIRCDEDDNSARTCMDVYVFNVVGFGSDRVTGTCGIRFVRASPRVS